MVSPKRQHPSVPIRFDHEEWREEVERLDKRSDSRIQAERARREIESGKAVLDFQKCEAAGEGGTSLPGCVKLYVPLGRQGASEAPFGILFQLAQDADGSFAWNFIAFGERHPENPATRSVYERAQQATARALPIKRPRAGPSITEEKAPTRIELV